MLDVIERRLEEGLALVEEDFHLEERLETASLLGASAASTDSLLHLVQGVFGGVQQGLVHGPVVVLRETNNVLHGDGVDSRVKLVRADSLE